MKTNIDKLNEEIKPMEIKRGTTRKFSKTKAMERIFLTNIAQSLRY
jgi:hypothetical protein